VVLGSAFVLSLGFFSCPYPQLALQWCVAFRIMLSIHSTLCVLIFACQGVFFIILFNPLNAELNPICCLLALLGAHHFLHVSRIKVKSLTLRLLMSYIYGAPILDVSRSHTTTHHSR